MNKRLQKDMGLGVIATAGIFLFHPIIAFVDVLPDLIGYLLLCVGTSLLADLNGHMAEAQRRFRIMLAVGAGQFLASVWVYRTLVSAKEGEINPYEAPTTLLLLSFLLLILQLCFLLPAMRELFLGLESLETRFDREGACKATERMKKSTPIALTLLSVLSVLPEVSILTSYENDKGNPLFPFDWYRYVSLFRTVAAILALAVGTVWVVRWLRLIHGMKHDRTWLAKLRTSYHACVLPQTGMFVVRRFRAGFLLLCIGTVFAVNLRLNYRAVLPGVGLSLFAILGTLLLWRVLSNKRTILWGSIALSACSLAQIVLNARFLAWHLPEASRFEEDAYRQFLAIRILDGAEAILTLVLLGILLSALYAFALQYANVDYGSSNGRERELSRYATQKLHAEFRARTVWTAVPFSLAAAVNVADAVLRLQLPWLWSVSFVLSIVGIWQFFTLTQELLGQIQNHYASDGTNKNL